MLLEEPSLDKLRSPVYMSLKRFDEEPKSYVSLAAGSRCPLLFNNNRTIGVAPEPDVANSRPQLA